MGGVSKPDPCPKPPMCPWEHGPAAQGDGCCFPYASVSPLSDIKCAPLPPPVVYENIGEPSIVPDMTRPIMVDLPQQTEAHQQGAAAPKKCDPTPSCFTGENFKLVTKVLEHPEGNVMKQTLNHPLCPDAQLTVTITPPVPKKKEIRIPECKVPSVRPPQRPWLQCVENQHISDKVRRPLARICHRREVAPIVLSSSEFERIQRKITEKEEKKLEKEARCMELECERLKSRYRHSLWNYTVESLIERKRAEEKEKERATIEADKALMAEMLAEKNRESQEARAKAKRMMLHRKGLIRDFHSAMATSKLMKEVSDEQKDVSNRCEEQEAESPPFLNKVCLKKMAWVNNRPEYKKKDLSAPCSPELLELIRKDEKRVVEREAILQNEKKMAEALRHEEPLPYTEAYLKYIQEPKCDPDEGEGENKRAEQAARRRELFEDIQDRLTLDAFMEAREQEQERQAKCFNHYHREKVRFVKEKEKQLIAEKVKKNIEASERAAKVLMEMKVQKQGLGDKYNELREQWEKEYERKAMEKKKEHSVRMGLVYKDFWERRNEELCKRQLADASRHWARANLDARDNYKMECEEKEDPKREAAKELALYHKFQIADKKCREDKAKHIDCVYGYKAKQAHEQEEKEMRDYAHECMLEWAAKERPLLPLKQAMKKWDYEGGMFPHAPVPNLQVEPQGDDSSVEKAPESEGSKKTPAKDIPSYQTTSNRLGFCSGGT